MTKKFTNPLISGAHLKVFEKSCAHATDKAQLDALIDKHVPFLNEKDKAEARVIYAAKKRSL